MKLVWQPTPTWFNCTVVALGLGLVAVVLGRPDLLALGLAFAVPAVRAVWVRDRCGGEAAIGQSATEVTEGGATEVSLTLQGLPRAVATLAWTPQALERTSPASGAVTAAAPMVRVEPKQWGRHFLGPATSSVEDVSGLWRARGPEAKVPLRVRPLASRMVGGSGVNAPVGLNGEHLSSVRGEGTEIADLREYRPGDRMRRVVWRLSSRSDELHVVDARTERDTDVLVVLDTVHPAQELVEEPESSLDVAVRAATAIAEHYLGFGDRLGVHDLGWRVGHLPMRSGPRQAQVFIELLSRALRDEGQSRQPLRPVPVQRPGTLCFVCTPLLEDDVIAEIGRLRAMGCEVVVVDTLPPGIIDADSPAPEMVRLAVAWQVRRLLRGEVLDGLARHGVPVVSWRGPTSLTVLLAAMERAGRAPRLARR